LFTRAERAAAKLRVPIVLDPRLIGAGEFSSAEQRIKLHPLLLPDVAICVLYHELAHAVLYSIGADAPNNDPVELLREEYSAWALARAELSSLSLDATLMKVLAATERKCITAHIADIATLRKFRV
jgi:hypothetical protein